MHLITRKRVEGEDGESDAGQTNLHHRLRPMMCLRPDTHHVSRRALQQQLVQWTQNRGRKLPVLRTEVSGKEVLEQEEVLVR